MKKTIFYSVLALLSVSTLLSCEKDDKTGPYLGAPNAVVTLKTDPADGRFYMQLDDKTTLLPENVTEAPYGGKEVRAYVNYAETSGDPGKYSKSVFLHWADSIRTKSMAESFPEPGKNAAVYGNDPVEISKDLWPTVVEDGYLTVVIKTLFAGGQRHEVNLVKGEKPGEVILYHDAKGEVDGYWNASTVAFRLDDLGDMGTEETELTLKWKSFNSKEGEWRQATFKYLPRTFDE